MVHISNSGTAKNLSISANSIGDNFTSIIIILLISSINNYTSVSAWTTQNLTELDVTLFISYFQVNIQLAHILYDFCCLIFIFAS